MKTDLVSLQPTKRESNTTRHATHVFNPRNKCPRCGSKAIYYKREGKRINIVRCGLCTALWKEHSRYVAGPDFIDQVCKLGDGPISKFADKIISSESPTS